uniref:Uncharacterized protein n=1 Tax=Pyrodinium bahamense TaxID=73915 RepID=A0A7S0A475_9DINO
MVDRKATLPQALCGGGAGLPCARWRPKPWKERFPEVGLRVTKEVGEPLPGTGDLLPEHIAFSGTRTLPWGMARARSMGAMQEGGVIDRALTLRTETDLDVLIKVLMSTVSSEKPEELREFRRPFNAHRHTISNFVPDDLRRQKVIRALSLYPMADIYDLARCSPRRWSSISRELGGVSHGDVMRRALDHLEKTASPLDRAAFWTAVGPRAKLADRGRVCGFAAADSPTPSQRL